MNLVQIIGVLIVLGSLVALAVVFLPVDSWRRTLRERRLKARYEDAIQDEGSLLDGAPRDELDQLGGIQTASAEPQSALLSEPPRDELSRPEGTEPPSPEEQEPESDQTTRPADAPEM